VRPTISATLTGLLLCACGPAMPPAGSAAPRSPGPVRHVVTRAEAPLYVIAGGKGRARLYLNASTGARDAALSVLRLDVGADVPTHAHAASAEILLVEQGRISMVIGGRTYRAGAGDAVYIPAGVEHSAHPEETVTAVQVYVGPGPEQRFAKGQRVREE